MPIDIDKLTEAELVDLNHRIVERLRFLQQMKAHARMLEFRIGDRVAFRAEGGDAIEGMLTRYNRRTVTVITDDGRHWNVSPTFLSRVEPAAARTRARSNVISLKQTPAEPPTMPERDDGPTMPGLPVDGRERSSVPGITGPAIPPRPERA